MSKNSLFRKCKIFLNNPWRVFYHFNYCKASHLFSDKTILKVLFRARMGYRLNLDEPVTFNEKLQWLKLYNRNPEYTKLVDKYEVRDYIKEKIGEQYLIPILGVWNSVDEIKFNELPNQFVLKCTHDSGSVVICKDKELFDIDIAKQQLAEALKKNFYYINREWPYKNVKPRIIAEELLKDGERKDLPDYKLMCFNGKAKCCFTCTNRFSEKGLNVTFYDSEWNILPVERMYPRECVAGEKPQTYKLMIELAEKLSCDLPFVRIDFYEVDDKPYFGEITFFPGAGMEPFNPKIWDSIMGDWIVLPEKKR